MITQQCPTRVATGQLPNLIIIGSQKAGTTSLHDYLSAHPEIFMSKTKELHYFAGHNSEMGLDWYRSQFKTDKPVRGESSTIYTCAPKYGFVPERIANLIPNAKLIYVLRDPIARTLSNYSHFVADDREFDSFETAVFVTNTHAYLERSLYFMQLSNYLKWFDKEQILIFSAESLESNRQETLAKVFRFLGVDDAFESPRFERKLNATSKKRVKNKLGRAIADLSMVKKLCKVAVEAGIPFSPYAHWPWPFSEPARKPVLSSETRARLLAAIEPDVALLRQFTGQSFSEWSI